MAEYFLNKENFEDSLLEEQMMKELENYEYNP